MFKNFKSKIFLSLAIILCIYIIICNFLVSFSISVTLCFIVAIFLLSALFYINTHKRPKEEYEPSFIYIFIKVSSVLYFTFMIAMILFNIFYKKIEINDDTKFDYVIVFGASIPEGKTGIINSRLDKAISFAKINKRPKFILTGAKLENEPIEEAYYMKNYMVNAGVDENRIIADPFSINTFENIENALNLIELDISKRNLKERIITRPYNNKSGKFDLGFINIGFMTSEFHLTRVSLMAKKLGVNKPYSIYCDTSYILLPYMYVRENLSLLIAFVLEQIKMN